MSTRQRHAIVALVVMGSILFGIALAAVTCAERKRAGPAPTGGTP